jgi:putative ABC transport system permease protein
MNLFRRRDRELNEELQSHLSMAVHDRMNRGESRAEAEAAAHREIGNIGLVKEVTREMWGFASLERFLQDLRFGLRMLTKSPAFTIAAVLTLALGIGANAAIFSVVYGVLLRPLAYRDAARIALVFMNFSPQNSPRGNLSLADYFDWKAQNRSFDAIGLYANGVQEITGDGTPEQVISAHVTANFFSLLGGVPRLGRTFAEGEDQASSARLAVIGEALWRRHFGADPNILGKAVMLSGDPTTIIGVMPAAFHFPRQQTELWMNYRLVPPKRRGPFFFTGIAHLKPGVSFEQAQSDTNFIARNIEHDNPNTYARLTMPVLPLRDAMVGNVRPALWMMFGAVAFVLLVAMVNVANLTLARSTVRRREMAVRIGLGATRLRLVRQLLTESVVIGILGAFAGLAFAGIAVVALQRWNPTDLLPRVGDIRLDWRVVIFTFAVAILTSALFGLIPALRASASDPHLALKEGGRSGGLSASGLRTHSALAVFEIALSLVLLAGAGLLVRSLIELQRVRTGVGAEPRHVLSVYITATNAKYRDVARGLAFYRNILDSVRALPGVEAAGMADVRPPNWWEEDDSFNIDGQPWSQGAFPSTPVGHVMPGYFETLQIPLLRGRYFTDGDRRDAHSVVIISESLAKRYFPHDNPLGHVMHQSQPELHTPAMEIVGVVGDVKYQGLDSKNSPMAYYTPVAQSFVEAQFLYVRSLRAAASLAPEIERAIHGIDRDAVVNREQTLEISISNSASEPRFRTTLLGSFALAALLLAAIGVYGVIAYSVAQRTQEFGIRMALGAQPSDVLRLVVGKGAALGAAGVALGLVASLLLTRTLERFLFQVKTTDAPTLVTVAAVLGLVAIFAGYLPARRAVRVDPTIALRYE